MLGGGTGPATGTNATTCTPGPWNIHRMLEASEALPMNLGYLGKGNASLPRRWKSRSLPAPWGSSCTRTGAPPGRHRQLPHGGRQIRCTGGHTYRHPERIGLVEHTLAAMKGRTIHTYHTEGLAAATHRISSRRAVIQRTALLHQPDAPLHHQHH